MCLEAVEQFVAFLGDEAFAQLKLGLALLEVLSGDALEVVDVVNVHVLELVAVGIDVARHGNVHEQQRPVATLPEQPLKLVACEHVVRRGGAANDNVNLLELLLPRVEADGAAIIEARGLSSAASAASAAVDHVHDWVLGTGEGDWVSMGVSSDGSYGVPEGLLCGLPATCADGCWSVVQGLELDEFSRARIDASVAELEFEREMVRGLGLL